MSKIYFHWFLLSGKTDFATFLHTTALIRGENAPFNLMFRKDHPQAEILRKTFEERSQEMADVMYSI